MKSREFRRSVICVVFALVALMSLSSVAQVMDKTIGVIVFDRVLTSDVTAPLEVFGAASRQSWFSDYRVITIGITDEKIIETEEGLRIEVDFTISDAPRLDALVVPSRYEMASLIANKELIAYIRKQSREAQWLASNCSGALLLAEAGLLDGKKATTWAGGEDDMQRDYQNVMVQHDTNYVLDGNILTSNGGVVSYQAALKLLALMSSESRAEAVAQMLQYDRL